MKLLLLFVIRGVKSNAPLPCPYAPPWIQTRTGNADFVSLAAGAKTWSNLASGAFANVKLNPYIYKEAIFAALRIIHKSVRLGARRSRALRALCRPGVGLYKRLPTLLGCTRSLPSEFPCGALRIAYTVHRVRVLP